MFQQVSVCFRLATARVSADDDALTARVGDHIYVSSVGDAKDVRRSSNARSDDLIAHCLAVQLRKVLVRVDGDEDAAYVRIDDVVAVSDAQRIDNHIVSKKCIKIYYGRVVYGTHSVGMCIWHVLLVQRRRRIGAQGLFPKSDRDVVFF